MFSLFLRVPIGLVAAGLVAALSASNAGAADERFPHYDRVLQLEKTAQTSANVSIGDVNGDGHADIVIANGRHWPLVSRVFLGDGKGRFSAGYDLGEQAYRSYSARLADMDGDGALDVALSNDAPDAKLVYLNDGKGHFRAGSSYGLPEWPTRNATVADLNGDRLPDIVVANRSEEVGNFICLNRGRGRFDADCPRRRSPPLISIVMDGSISSFPIVMEVRVTCISPARRVRTRARGGSHSGRLAQPFG